jgi:hypothetical protein
VESREVDRRRASAWIRSSPSAQQTLQQPAHRIESNRIEGEQRGGQKKSFSMDLQFTISAANTPAACT